MNKAIIDKVTLLNHQFIEQFLGSSHEHEEVVAPSSVIPSLDTNNISKYDFDYFDLMVANILLERHQDVRYTLSANLAEIITRMAYEGIRRMKIFADPVTYRFCNDIALHRIPRSAYIYQYLNFVLRYQYNVLPFWFYYTLLLWGFIETEKFNHTAYRSRMYVGFIHNCCSIKFSDHRSDRCHDVLKVKEKMSRLILSCMKDPRFENDEQALIAYIVDSLRIFSVIILSALMSRSCDSWPIFRALGNEVMTQRLIEHQSVIDASYQQLTKKGGNK